MSSSSIDLLASITLLVGLCVKVDEQQEVAGEQGAAKVGGILGSTAVAKSREGGVGKGKVSVGAEVDDEQVDDELNDLHGSEIFLPPDSSTSSSAEVVPVHENVDSQVQDDRNPRDRGGSDKLSVAKQCSHTVVEPVKEFELLLLDDEEDGVKQLPVLDQIVKVIQKLQLLSPSLRRADGEEDTIFSNNRNQFLNQKHQQDKRNSCQEQVVDLEQHLELESWQLSHKQLAAENNNEISNARNKNFIVGGERSDALDKGKAGSRLSGGKFIGLAKVIPEVNTKWSLYTDGCHLPLNKK